jgi:16S rRNA G527 N7-methylase RsmG
VGTHLLRYYRRGLSAVPLAVADRGQVVALEANQKKSLFLKEVKDELSLRISK